MERQGTTPPHAALIRFAMSSRRRSPATADLTVEKDTFASRTKRDANPRPSRSANFASLMTKLVQANLYQRKRQEQQVGLDGNLYKPSAMRRRMGRTPLAEQIRELRTQRGLTQDALAKLVGVSKEAVRLWESGGGMHGAQAVSLAGALGVRVEELRLEDQPSRKRGASDPFPSRTKLIERMGDLFDDADRRHILVQTYSSDPGEEFWSHEVMRRREIEKRLATKYGSEAAPVPRAGVKASRNAEGRLEESPRVETKVGRRTKRAG